MNNKLNPGSLCKITHRTATFKMNGWSFADYIEPGTVVMYIRHFVPENEYVAVLWNTKVVYIWQKQLTPEGVSDD